MLGGVQSHRVDVSIGGIAWSEERQKEGLFTDPAYYSPPAMAVHGTEKYSTIADLEGKDLGTVTGYVWVKSIQAIPGAKLHAYPDANGVLNDLSSGRIEVGLPRPADHHRRQGEASRLRLHDAVPHAADGRSRSRPCRPWSTSPRTR